MGAKPSEGEPKSFKRFWDFIKSRKCDNSVVLPPPLSIKNFRQFSPTRILSLTWVPLRTLIWLTSTSTNHEKVCKTLRDLKPHSATGPDEIPQWLLKNFASILTRPLSCIFKASIDQGHDAMAGAWCFADVAACCEVSSPAAWVQDFQRTIMFFHSLPKHAHMDMYMLYTYRI